jgi:hypothetical protein
MNGQKFRRLLTVSAISVVLSAAPAWADYSLEISASPEAAGVAASFPVAGALAEGTEVTVTATPAEGWVFAGWQGDIVSTESSLVFPMTGDTQLVALFVEDEGPQYSLTLLNDPSGAGALVRDPAQETYTSGSTVTLTVYPADGYVFTGWDGDIPEDADANATTLTLTMDQDRDVYATYSAASTVAPGAAAGSGCGAIGIVGMGSLLSMMFVLRLGRHGH